MTDPLAILGGCGGIGRTLVAAAAEAGCQPVVLDLAASIEAHPPDQGTAIEVDATSAECLKRAADQIRTGGEKLAGLVNLCGFMGPADPVVSTDPGDWTEIVDGNLGSAFRAAAAFAPLIRRGGSIVNIGSGLGHFPRPGYGPYAVSKAGIAMLTRQLALELAPDIRVNAVAPSAVDTAFLRGGTGRSDEDETPRFDIAAYGSSIPLGRIATPDDIVGPILFLLSDAAGYVTGQTLHVNGGAFMP